MVPAALHAPHHEHSHDHAHSHGHDHTHAHVHSSAAPHPAQAASWSILRMTMAARLTAAGAVCVVLWGMVFLAMR